MKKLNPIIYQKLLLQAEEAKERKMTKLAAAVFNTLGPIAEDESITYNFDELKDDVYQDLWKAAACVIKYHDLQSADIEKVNEALEAMASKLIDEVERSLSVDSTQVGPLEEKVLGQE